MAKESSTRSFWHLILHRIQEVRQDRLLWLGMIGNTFFCFLGSLFAANVIGYATSLGLGVGAEVEMMAGMGFGFALGGYLAGGLFGRKIEYGLIPLGAILAFGSSLLLTIHGWSFLQSALLLGLVGLNLGFVVVPINTMLRQRADSLLRGTVLAMANVMTFGGILLGGGICWLAAVRVGLSSSKIFMLGSILTLFSTIYLLKLLPDSLMRLVIWLLTHSLYRIRTLGRDNIPVKGGALFAVNHVSFVDAMLLVASTDRYIRFLMDEEIYNLPYVKPFARMMRVIPISGRGGLRSLIYALREAARSIAEGDVVGIFPEGQISRTGQLLPFRKGFERIMKNVDAPIVPIHLDRVWGSIFSFEKRRFFWKFPSHPLRPVTVSYGPSMPARSTAEEVRQAVQELGTTASVLHKKDQRQLQRAFVRFARRHPWRFAAADGLTPSVTYFGLLIRSIILARLLRRRWDEEEMVGLLLPPSVAGAVINIAALLAGKIPVNLNYTLPPAILRSCIDQCQVRMVFSSRKFLEKIKLEMPVPVVFLEDLAPTIRKVDKSLAILQALLLPLRWLERTFGHKGSRSVDALATIIFSSGSTGDPKGVMLSHYNVYSNIEGIDQVFATTCRDRILGVLPFFHSFGFTGTLWFPLATGLGSIYHPNPLDARVIAALTERYGATILLATPTFLQGYIRRCRPESFGSLDYVMVGAEKLSERIAGAFEEKFGIRPMEGYGCTECSPIVSVNVRNFRARGFFQVGQKRGRIGHPLPGISVKIVDPDTFQPLPVGMTGLLLVKGPNVMMGYLNRPEKTAEVVRDGWYVTGDLAKLDDDGFLTIADRLSRFSKIGGEMVPHLKVEEVLYELSGLTEPTFAVTGVPDERKGERLVVLHSLPSEEKLRELQSRIATSGLPNLWVPRSNSYFQVEKIPLLGTGKLDLRAIREEAVRLSKVSMT